MLNPEREKGGGHGATETLCFNRQRRAPSLNLKGNKGGPKVPPENFKKLKEQATAMEKP